MSTVTDLIWVQTGFIGDIVLTTAAIELARRTLPQARQHVVTTPIGAKVLAGSPPLVSRAVFDKSGKSALAAFRATRQALADAGALGDGAVILQAHRSYRSSLLCRYLGLPTIAYREAGFGFLAGRRVPRVAVLHEAARIALLLEPLGVPRTAMTAARPALSPLPLDPGGWSKRLVEHLGSGGRLVGVAPGSVWGTKRWTPEGFQAVLAGLIRQEGILPVLIGSAAEKDVAAGLAAGLPKDEVVDLAGRTSLDDLRRLFPNLALLLSNDSSPVHYASAFNVPTVAVFGATVPGMGFGPLADGSVALGTDLSCRPCSDHGPAVCPLGHFRCMKELGADRVLSACLAALGQGRTPAEPRAYAKAPAGPSALAPDR